MVDFADLHCHILGSVDDGADDDNEMKKMLDIAYSDGIRTICFTPHFKQYEFQNESEIIRYNSQIDKSFKSALDYTEEKYPQMKLYLGNEIMYHHDILDSLRSSFCSRLGNSPYVLVEFESDISFFCMQSAVSKLLRKGVHPVIAHIERYGTLIKNAKHVSELRELGALTQVNSKEIQNLQFGKTARFLKTVLKKSLVDIIASDAHDANSFSPKISESYYVIEKLCGTEYARKICSENPKRILNYNINF